MALEYYANRKTFEGSLSLSPKDETVPVTPTKYAGTAVKERNVEYLSTIIEELNRRFGTDFTPAEKLSLEQIKEDFARDREMIIKAKNNSIEDFGYAYRKVFLEKVVDRMDQNEKFFMKIIDDEQFAAALMEHMLAEVYHTLRNMEI